MSAHEGRADILAACLLLPLPAVPMWIKGRLQRGAGHDDPFEGPTWATEILPLVREVIRTSDRR